MAPFVEFDVCTLCKPDATWSGPADHSAAIALAWTPKTLYAGLKVFDDTHQNPGSGWNGDAVEVMFANAARTGSSSANKGTGEIDTPSGMICYKFGMSDSDGSYTAYSETDAACTGECVEMAAARDDANMITTYELVFPASALGRDAFDMRFAFGVGINVNDGDTGPGQAGQAGWSGWAPYGTVHGGRQAENTGLATLVGAPLPGVCVSIHSQLMAATHHQCKLSCVDLPVDIYTLYMPYNIIVNIT
jgi:hypothetical protein